MTYVVTLRDFLPPPRYDAVAWATARIEESATGTGSWSTLETQALSPTDSDPSAPAVRNFTTALATIASGGWYRVTFIDGNSAESAPSDPVQNAAASTGSTYITASSLKSTLSLSGYSYADDDIDAALISAGRAIDNLCNRRFYLDPDATAVRYYTPDRWDRIDIDDLTTLGSVKLDMDGTFTFGTTLTLNTDYVLDPLNAATDGRPYERVVILPTSGTALQQMRPRSVKVTGQFGWPSVPVPVQEATAFLAGRLLRQAREAPFGVVTYGDNAIRIARTDPNVIMLCGPYARHRIAVA